MTGCAANQGRSAGLDGASAARFLPTKAQRPEHSYSGKSTTSPYFMALLVHQLLKRKLKAAGEDLSANAALKALGTIKLVEFELRRGLRNAS